jgi:hypothetical protein
VETRERARVVVGVERDVLDPVVLLARLPIDDGRDVERETVQVHTVAARADLGHERRAEVVDVELHRPLGVMGLQMHVIHG